MLLAYDPESYVSTNSTTGASERGQRPGTYQSCGPLSNSGFQIEKPLTRGAVRGYSQFRFSRYRLSPPRSGVLIDRPPLLVTSAARRTVDGDV